MIDRRRVLWQLASMMGCMGLAIGCASRRSTDEEAAVPSIALTVKALTADGMIPVQYTCDGDTRSPALAWGDLPAATRSLVLIVDDPDAPGRTFVHWLVYDLPADLRQLPENLPTQPFLAAGGVQGKNDFGHYGYGSPCPPSGTHHYVFKLYALDMLLDLPPGTETAEVVKAMQGHILAKGEAIGRYQRQR